MASEGQDQVHPPPPRQPTPAQHQPPLGETRDLQRVCRRWRVQLSQEGSHAQHQIRGNIRSGETLEVQAVSKLPQLDTTITFLDYDMEGCQHPHDNPLVVKAVVDNKTIHRVLVDNISSTNIIVASSLKKNGHWKGQARASQRLPTRVLWRKSVALGVYIDSTNFGRPPSQATITVRFLIVDAPSAYNMLLGRPSLNTIRAIPSAYHMVIKFPTANGVGMVRENQRVARECYSTSMKQKMVDNIYIDELDMQDEVSTRPAPSEELEPVQLENQPEHLVYIGSKLAKEVRSLLIHFLKQNMEVFDWKQEDMGGIDPTVITHRLNVSPSFKPIKQKRRSFTPERQKAINEEVGKLLQVDAIREVEYPEWLTNVVLVKKENGKWRLCINFTDINRACPKDSFPLPRIDLIVDATAGHELLNFMDAFSGYN